MYNVKSASEERKITLLFFLVPTIFIIAGLLFFPYPIPKEMGLLLPLPLFGCLALLLVGFFLKKEGISNKLKIAGWVLFAFFWSTQQNSLYFGVDGDIFNVILCIVGVYALFYFSYHEWLSLKSKEQIRCLNWAAGAAAIAGLIYFAIELTPLAPWLIETVATHSGGLLNIFIGNVEVEGVNIFCNGSFAVSIIFACTAVQSMVLFVGMILPLANVEMKRKIYGLLITVVPIYFLNLVRNAVIAYLIKDNHDLFFIAHNVIGKGGSLIALVILLFIVIKIVPEIFDEIICLTELHKRNGPVEKFLKRVIRGKS